MKEIWVKTCSRLGRALITEATNGDPKVVYLLSERDVGERCQVRRAISSASRVACVTPMPWATLS